MSSDALAQELRMTEPMVSSLTSTMVLLGMLIRVTGYSRGCEVVLESSPGRCRRLGCLRAVQNWRIW